MRKLFIYSFLSIFLCTAQVHAEMFFYILNDECINRLYYPAVEHFKDTEIEVLRDSYGIILRFYFFNTNINKCCLDGEILQKLPVIEDFLAKIKNPVIIEVHTSKFSDGESEDLKNWEISTIIANKIEDEMWKSGTYFERDRRFSIGYGEFFPCKNTPNNGGKYKNRVDIIILCNISGE